MQPDTGPAGSSKLPPMGPLPVPTPAEPLLRCIPVEEEDATERTQFEHLLTDMASRLANVADEQFDEVVTGCLRMLVEFLGFDRSTLMAFSQRGASFQVTHSWAVEGVPVPAKDVMLNSHIPWFTHQIRSGHIVSVSSSIDLPTVAVQERACLLQTGLKSTLAIPLLTEGTIVGALAFGSFRRERRWLMGLVSGLRLAGEIMALGIRRHQYARGLKTIAEAMDEVSLSRVNSGTKAAEHFRHQATRLMQAEQQERRRMGQVLHEDVMQILAAVGMLVHSGQSGEPQSPASVKAAALLKDALEKLRQLTLELRPEYVFEMTLSDGIAWLADQVRRRYDLYTEIHIDDTVPPVSDDVRSFLYDTSRKLLENVAVHASCKNATLTIRRPDPNYIQLTVRDEGVGFNPASVPNLPNGAFGLFSIREQVELLGGMLEVSSAVGRGTRAVVTVPSGD